LIQEPSIAPIRMAELSEGHAGAQYNLGFMYDNGRGVPQDDVQAHMWFNLAVSRSTGENRETAVSFRDRIAEELTPDVFNEAQRLALEWYAAHPREP
jgi:TPR repeat protein